MILDVTQIDKLKKRTSCLKNEYSTFEAHHRELSEYVLPRLGRWLLNDTNKGGKKNGKIYDNTAKIALGVLSSGLMSGLTSPARPWFNLSHPNPELQEKTSVKMWTDLVKRRMNYIFAKSNIYKSLPSCYSELALFGQGPLGIFEDDDDVIFTQNYTAGEYFIANNRKGIVDTFSRSFRLSVAQVVASFGLKNCSETVRSMYDNGYYDSWVDLYHTIEPNYGRDFKKADSINKPFGSIYIEQSSSKDVLEFKGFDEFPIMCPRWEVNSSDVYASSCPAMDALGDIKQLQTHEKRAMEAIEKLVRPPMVASPELKNRHKTQLPGAVTYTNFQNGTPGFLPAYQVNLRINELEGKSEQIRDRIRKAFYVDLFLSVINSDRRQITAREIEEKHEEKLLMLGPVLERLNKELLDPLITRTFNIMYRKGLVPPPPPEIEGSDLKIDYISVLHQAQRSVGISAVERLLTFSSNVIALNPSSRHKINFDQAIDEYGNMLGTSPALIRSDDDAKELANAEYEAQLQQQKAVMGMNAAKAAKDLSQVNNNNNALSTIVDALPSLSQGVISQQQQ